MSEGNKEKSIVAKRLRMLRAQNGMSQTDIAKDLGISQQTYSKYENECEGKSVPMDSEIIKKLCEIYGVSADYILGIEKKENPTMPQVTSMVIDNNVDLIVQQVLSKLKQTNEEKK